MLFREFPCFLQRLFEIYSLNCHYWNSHCKFYPNVNNQQCKHNPERYCNQVGVYAQRKKRIGKNKEEHAYNPEENKCRNNVLYVLCCIGHCPEYSLFLLFPGNKPRIAKRKPYLQNKGKRKQGNERVYFTSIHCIQCKWKFPYACFRQYFQYKPSE